eukprot:SAG11_NODE_3190_length_2623_cov_2.275357_2_plen_258_part_00
MILNAPASARPLLCLVRCERRLAAIAAQYRTIECSSSAVLGCGKGDDEQAVELLRTRIIDAGGATAEKVSDAYRLAGKWMASSRSESSTTIIEEFLTPAIEHAKKGREDGGEDPKRMLKAQYLLATYAEGLLESLSQDAVQLQGDVRKLDKEIEEWKERNHRTKKNAHETKQAQKEKSQTQAELERVQRRQEELVGIAMRNYLNCVISMHDGLDSDHKYDILVVSKLVSLWFKTGDTRSNWPHCRFSLPPTGVGVAR